MSRVSILRIRGHLLVPMQADLDDALVEQFQREVLEAIASSTTGRGGLLIEIGSLEVVDTYVARVLADTAHMAALMGCQTILCGMRPEIAATLVQLGFTLDGVCTALNVDDGLDLLGLPR